MCHYSLVRGVDRGGSCLVANFSAAVASYLICVLTYLFVLALVRALLFANEWTTVGKFGATETGEYFLRTMREMVRKMIEGP